MHLRGWIARKITKFHRRFSWFWIILHPPVSLCRCQSFKGIERVRLGKHYGRFLLLCHGKFSGQVQGTKNSTLDSHSSVEEEGFGYEKWHEDKLRMTRGTVRSLSMKNVCSQFSYRVSAWSPIFVLSLCRSPTTSSIVRLYLRWSQADRIIRSLNGREKHEQSFLSCYYDNVINFVSFAN